MNRTVLISEVIIINKEKGDRIIPLNDEIDLEDFISKVVTESEDLTELKSLALKINKIGSQLADKMESYESSFNSLERRVSTAEDEFEVIVEGLMDAPPTINLGTLSIMTARSTATSIPGPQAPGASAIPNLPTIGGPGPKLSAGPSINTTNGGPNLNAQPNLSAAPTTTSAAGNGPNLSATPLTTTSPRGPNLDAAPVVPNTPTQISGGEPNLNAAPAVPSTGPNLSAGPSPASSGAPTPSAPTDDPSAMLNMLQKAPVQETAPADPVFSGAGAAGFNPAEALKGLKKAPPKEEKPKDPVFDGAGAAGFNPAEALKGLKKAPPKEEKPKDPVFDGAGPAGFNPAAALKSLKKVKRDDDEISSSTSEFESVLENEPEEKAQAPQSAEDMKSQLQARLKKAFKK